jgi:hypothetical protein
MRLDATGIGMGAPPRTRVRLFGVTPPWLLLTGK